MRLVGRGQRYMESGQGCCKLEDKSIVVRACMLLRVCEIEVSDIETCYIPT